MNAVATYGHFNTTVQLPNKADCYSYHVSTYTDWMKRNGKDDPFDSVADYFRDLNQSHYAAGTVRMKRQAVINRLRLAADLQGLSMEKQFQFDKLLKRLNTDAETKAPKTASQAIGSAKVLTEGEFNRVLLKARSRKQQLFVRFLWQTGCRVSELCGAELRHCKREGSTVAVRVRGKGNKEREIKITAGLFDDIRAEFRGEEYLFETSGGKAYRRAYVSEQIAKLTKFAIGRRLSAHKLRHSFATRQIQQTGKIAAVSQYLGHSSVSTTMAFYVHEELTDSDLFGAEVMTI